MSTTFTTAELDALIKVSKTVNASLELDAVLEAVMAVTTETMRAEASSLILFDQNAGELIFHVVQGASSGSVSQVRLPRSKGVVGWVVDNGQPAVVNDVTKDERFTDSIDRVSGFVTRSILCVPMKSKDGVIGAIEVLNRADGSEFSDNDVPLCEAVAAQAAIAIENATLHKKIVEAERLAVVGQTVAGSAHCIKNVLNGIQGGSYMVDSGLKKDNPKNISRGWEIVSKNNGFLQKLVHDMLAYSKEREPEYEPTDVNELADSICELMREKASLIGVDISFEGEEGLGAMVLDPTGIRRALLNLVSNAVDACESGEGEKRVEVSVNVGDSGTFVISVKDSGCGMAEEDAKRLFEPFFSTKGSKGTGLGLPVTHKIISEHKGQIKVDSKVGKGTTFDVILPALTEV